ncbi:helix-turn-helix transcriptional regulator [Bosea sp. (in: a-proteobacteria)]|uniref:helix-turn-helix domain-containing protein n=1 Tax=Bosea sp. (in: a-proteobacteria) TaxID=1871050 RepID=UPI001AD43CFB|nr:helix-turn-helix transcriptional regulator [Bosea sp. (in: a-proteobacteria)]MBN9435783.1 helix-turn-helix transcriptional regulator [Bosea sp. (in: a-proteobacteria)]
MNPTQPLSAAELLARNLRRLREERGLTIDDLAGRTGIVASRLAAIEMATAQAHLDEVTLLAVGLGVRIAKLFATE